VRATEHEAERRLFLLQIIQPGLVGLMDGSVSTLAPLFMTALGGLGHPLPYLIPDFRTATRIAIAVVLIELAAIAWIRRRYLETPFFSAALQVVVGGLCLRHGVAIGSS
jgi:hypothetical protein